MEGTELPKIAPGARAWGNDDAFGSGIDTSELKQIFNAAMAAGSSLRGTAYACSMGGLDAAELEGMAGTLGVSAIRFWEKTWVRRPAWTSSTP